MIPGELWAIPICGGAFAARVLHAIAQSRTALRHEWSRELTDHAGSSKLEPRQSPKRDRVCRVLHIAAACTPFVVLD